MTMSCVSCHGRRLLSSLAKSPTLVAPREAHRFIVECLESVGVKRASAALHADVLVEADCQGHFSHGINRLDVLYVKEIGAGLVNLDGCPRVLKETESTAWVDGDNCIGTTVGMYCMDLAMDKAVKSGVGWVTTKASNHFGITGWYSAQALQRNLIGVAFTNTTPLAVPTRGKSSALGTNTIAVAAPAMTGDDSFSLDMATTTVAMGKVEMKCRSGQPLPPNWLFSNSGELPSNETELFAGYGKTYFMYPLGGDEATAGYKGYGLSMMVEILCGVLGGGDVGPQIRDASRFEGEANLSQTFIAVNPAFFAEDFKERMSLLVEQCRSSLRLPGEGEVLVPGDPERISKERVEAEGGIHYDRNVLTALEKLASRLGVARMQFLPMK